MALSIRSLKGKIFSISFEKGDTNLKDSIESIFLAQGIDYQPDKGSSILLEPLAFARSANHIQEHCQENGTRILFDDNSKRLFYRILDLSKSQFSSTIFKVSRIEDSLLKEGFKRKLTKHQLRNVKKLLRIKHGASFSVPGAGKTTECLAYLSLRKALKNFTLVVCPKNAFISWEEQLSSCLPNIFPRRLDKGVKNIVSQLQKKSSFYLVSYSQIALVLSTVLHFLHNRKFNLVLDESHKIKRGDAGAWGKAVLALAPFAENRIILSGTPLPNSENDLIPQIKFLFPYTNDFSNPGTLIRPFFVRTTKKELCLPPLKVFRRTIPLSSGQRLLYDAITGAFLGSRHSSFNLSDKATLRELRNCYIRLLQTISNPLLLYRHSTRLFDHNLQASFQEGPKITWACHRARQLAQRGEKVLIWSYFKENIELLASHLNDLNAVLIYGDTKTNSKTDTDDFADSREARIHSFKKDPKVKVLVANPAACGESISLHDCCHHAIYVDRTYNAAHYLQSLDRIHRLGLKKNQITKTEILVSPNTIDDSIERRLSLKTRLMSRILSDPHLHIEPQEDESDDFTLYENKDDLDDFKREISGK